MANMYFKGTYGNKPKVKSTPSKEELAPKVSKSEEKPAKAKKTKKKDN